MLMVEKAARLVPVAQVFVPQKPVAGVMLNLETHRPVEGFK
jgi:hypothetical protein